MTHAGHIIEKFTNDNGLTKFRVTKIGETKQLGQTLTLARAKTLAEMFA